MRRRRHEPRAMQFHYITFHSATFISHDFPSIHATKRYNKAFQLGVKLSDVRCIIYIERWFHIIYSSFILTKVSYSDNVDKLLEHYLLIKSTFKEKYKQSTQEPPFYLLTTAHQNNIHEYHTPKKELLATG